jgi:hypothetical protein
VDEADLTVYIARDGVEIGECRPGDVEQLMREGELLPSDHYWHEGMENWLTLEEFSPPSPRPAVQIEATQRIATMAADEPATDGATVTAVPEAWDWKTLKSSPEFRKHLRLAGIIVGGFVLALVIAVLVIRLGHDATPVRRPAGSATAPMLDREQELKLRDKAAAELRGKLEALPARAAPPLNTFYYDVAVDMRRSGSRQAPWEALVRGSENTVDPQTEQTTKRTEFLLRTEYRDGHWTFKHYKASIRNLLEPEEIEEQHDDTTHTPPVLVTMLGLRIDPLDARSR